MAESAAKKQTVDRSLTMPVRLSADRETQQPALANYAHVNVAQGLAYLDFGFLEPTALDHLRRRAQQGEALPAQLDGRMATRVVLPIEALIRIQQQLTQIVQRLSRKPTAQS